MCSVTLSMIVKNEEKNLAGCLDSVKGIVDEIVVVDTGSRDDTVNIAERYGAKVFHFQWQDDFSEARNFALSKSNSDWILFLDADEKLDENSRNVLSELVRTNTKTGYRCNIYNIDEIHKKPKLQSSTRLFKNSDGIEFRGKAHEQIDASIIEKGYSIRNSGILINHTGYNISREGLREKADRNLKLLLQEYDENPTGYCAFQTANSYSILNQKEKAFQFYSKSLNESNLPVEYKAYALSNCAEYFLRAGETEKAYKTILDAVDEDPENIIANLTASEICYKFNKPTEAVEYCVKAYERNDALRDQKNSGRLLDVFLERESIIYHGLNIAYQSNEQSGLEYFFAQLELLKGKNGDEWDIELNLIQKASTGTQLLVNEIDDSIKLINENNIDFYLNLLTDYVNTGSKLAFNEKLMEKFPANIIVRNKYGYNLSKAHKTDEAIAVFEDSLRIINDDPSPVFYLFSLYLEKREMEKLSDLIDTSKKRFSENRIFIQHLKNFETKLSSIINTN